MAPVLLYTYEECKVLAQSHIANLTNIGPQQSDMSTHSGGQLLSRSPALTYLSWDY